MGLLHEAISEKVISAAREVHRRLGSGFPDGIYRNALVAELLHAGREVEVDPKLNVTYRGAKVGTLQRGLLVDGTVAVDLQPSGALPGDAEVELQCLLRITKLKAGLLIRFGHSGVEVKKLSRKA
ncbi:MAG: GxxExxY protein [Planctomycetota bacterium]|jgi:GxxExxY protein